MVGCPRSTYPSAHTKTRADTLKITVGCPRCTHIQAFTVFMTLTLSRSRVRHVWVCVVGEGGVGVHCVSCRVLSYVLCFLRCGVLCRRVGVGAGVGVQCVFVSVCGVARVCVVCGVWRGLARGKPPSVYIQHASVCTGKTPACSCGRVAGTHGDVLNVHTEAF